MATKIVLNKKKASDGFGFNWHSILESRDFICWNFAISPIQILIFWAEAIETSAYFNPMFYSNMIFFTNISSSI